MGTNRWRRAPTLAAMATDTLTLHCARDRAGASHRLQAAADPLRLGHEWTVDLADRMVVSSTIIHPWSTTSLGTANGVAFRAHGRGKARAAHGRGATCAGEDSVAQYATSNWAVRTRW